MKNFDICINMISNDNFNYKIILIYKKYNLNENYAIINGNIRYIYNKDINSK